MTVTEKQARKIISGSGWANPLTHDFMLENASHLKVYADDDQLVLGADYTVSDIMNPAGYSVTVNSPTLWAPDNWYLVVEPPIVQGDDLSGGGGYGTKFENALDATVRRLQAVDSRAQRGLRAPAWAPPGFDTAVELTPGGVLGIRSDGSGFETRLLSDDVVPTLSADDLRDFIGVPRFVTTKAAARAILDIDSANWVWYDNCLWLKRTGDQSARRVGSALTTTNADSATNVFTRASHGLNTGAPVIVTAEANGFLTQTVYYAIRHLPASDVDTNNKFKLAETLANAIAGTAIDFLAGDNITLRELVDQYQVRLIVKDGDIAGSQGLLERQFEGPIDLRWGGGVPGSAAINNSPAFQACAEALPLGGGSIRVPSGGGVAIFSDTNRWACADTIVTTRPVSIVGDQFYSSVLYWNGAQNKPLFIHSVYGATYKNLGVRGASDAGGNVFITGSSVYKSDGSVMTENCYFSFFENTAVFNAAISGGFYHEHKGSWFERCKIFFKNYTSNNVRFEACKFGFCEQFITCNGGSGPLVLMGCSFECWTGIGISSVSGASFNVTIIGPYVENYPSLTAEAGIGTPAQVYNTGSFVFANGGSVAVFGGMVSTKGVTRFTTSHPGSVTCIGTHFIFFSSGANDTLQYVFHGTAAMDLHCSGITYEGTPGASFVGFNTAVYRGSGMNPLTREAIVNGEGVTLRTADADFSHSFGISTRRQQLNATLTANRTITINGPGITRENSRPLFARNGSGDFAYLIPAVKNLRLGDGELVELARTDPVQITMTLANPAVFTHVAHGRLADDPIFVYNWNGALPSSITNGNLLFVRNVLSADTYTVSASPGGAEISTAALSQSGTHFVASLFVFERRRLKTKKRTYNADADTTHEPRAQGNLLVLSGALSTNRTLTLTSTYAFENEELDIVIANAGANSWVIEGSNWADKARGTLRRVGAAWELVRYGIGP